MSNIGFKGIVVKEETYEKLLRRKKYPKHSFNDVIEELIDNDKK